MSFRLRVALLTATAVAVAAIAAGAVMYLLVQQQLDTAFNDTLRTSAQTARLQGGPRPDDRFGRGIGLGSGCRRHRIILAWPVSCRKISRVHNAWCTVWTELCCGN